MTSDAAPPTQPKNEAEYARKLALAILSTLESKGFLTKMDVDTILHVAHRAALQAEAPAAALGSAPELQKSVLTAPVEVKRPLGPAVLGTRWVKPETITPPSRRAETHSAQIHSAEARSATADLAHEPGAVKVLEQAASGSSPRQRPLAPAIVSAGKPGTVQPEPLKPEPEPTAEAGEAAPLAAADGASAKAPEQKRDNPPVLPVVIDFEMD